MESVPKDVMINKILIELPAKDIFAMCMINKKAGELCNSSSDLWPLLLKRDFEISHVSSNKIAKKLYRDYYEFVYNWDVYAAIYFFEKNAFIYIGASDFFPKDLKWSHSSEEVLLHPDIKKNLIKLYNGRTDLWVNKIMHFGVRECAEYRYGMSFDIEYSDMENTILDKAQNTPYEVKNVPVIIGSIYLEGNEEKRIPIEIFTKDIESFFRKHLKSKEIYEDVKYQALYGKAKEPPGFLYASYPLNEDELSEEWYRLPEITKKARGDRKMTYNTQLPKNWVLIYKDHHGDYRYVKKVKNTPVGIGSGRVMAFEAVKKLNNDPNTVQRVNYQIISEADYEV